MPDTPHDWSRLPELTDPYRPGLDSPFRMPLDGVADATVATDGARMILIVWEDLGYLRILDDRQRARYEAGIRAALARCDTLDRLETFDLAVLRKFIAPCEKCDDTGEVTFGECGGHGYECDACDECNGFGTLPCECAPRSDFVQLFTGVFDRRLVGQLLRVLPDERVEWQYSGDPHAPSAIRGDCWTAIIMPTRSIGKTFYQVAPKFDELSIPRDSYNE